MKKESTFKMNGFTGFGNSVKDAVLGISMGSKKSGKLRDKLVRLPDQSKKSGKLRDNQKMNTNDPDRPGSKGMYPTGFETKIPRINKLKKL
tara:strand:+ start:209 stop:481 length:273 start_codon:yes stop_codon:yes gene_type:complete